MILLKCKLDKIKDHCDKENYRSKVVTKFELFLSCISNIVSPLNICILMILRSVCIINNNGYEKVYFKK